jgi:hypothetical protein
MSSDARDRSETRRSKQGKGRRPRPTLARHQRKCSVCRHPHRDLIEHDYLHWCSPDDIAAEYHIADHSSVYRHAHATGLFDRRRARVRSALAHIIERASQVKVTAHSVISAVIACTHINSGGEWIESPRVRHRISGSTTAPSLKEPNRQTNRTENAPTQ